MFFIQGCAGQCFGSERSPRTRGFSPSPVLGLGTTRRARLELFMRFYIQLLNSRVACPGLRWYCAVRASPSPSRSPPPSDDLFFFASPSKYLRVRFTPAISSYAPKSRISPAPPGAPGPTSTILCQLCASAPLHFLMRIDSSTVAPRTQQNLRGDVQRSSSSPLLALEETPSPGARARIVGSIQCPK